MKFYFLFVLDIFQRYTYKKNQGANLQTIIQLT